MKPHCDQVQDRILEAFGTDGSSLDDSTLQEHLRICDACGEWWEDFQQIQKGMEQTEQATGPSELTRRRILQAARHEQAQIKYSRRHPAWRFFLSRPVKVAAMFALIIGVGIYSKNWLEEQRPEPVFLAPPTAVEAPRPAPPAEPAVPPAPRLEKAKGSASPRGPTEFPKTTAPAAAPEAPQPALTPTQPGLGAGGAPSGLLKAKDKVILREEAMDAEVIAEPPKEEPAKLLQAPAAAPPAPPEKKQMEQEISAEETRTKKAAAPSDEQVRLLSEAKAKMARGDYAAALEDLLKAQSLGTNREIEELIGVCRKTLQAK